MCVLRPDGLVGGAIGTGDDDFRDESEISQAHEPTIDRRIPDSGTTIGCASEDVCHRKVMPRPAVLNDIEDQLVIFRKGRGQSGRVGQHWRKPIIKRIKVKVEFTSHVDALGPQWYGKGMRVNFNVTEALGSSDVGSCRASRRIGRLLGIYGFVALAGAAVHMVAQIP